MFLNNYKQSQIKLYNNSKKTFALNSNNQQITFLLTELLKFSPLNLQEIEVISSKTLSF